MQRARRRAVGDRVTLRSAREDKQLTQAALAALVPCNQSSISRLERGSVPEPAMRRRLAQLLGVSIKRLAFGSEATSNRIRVRRQRREGVQASVIGGGA